MLSYKDKIFIDRVFGSVAAFILNGLTRLLGLILRRNHALPKDPKVIVVTKFVGLGSILHSGILCRALRVKFPATKLVYITSIDCKEFIARMNYIDQILTIDDKTLFKMVRSTALLIFSLWRLRPELYFDLELYSSWSSIIATLSLARNRYGFFRKSTAFRLGLHSHLLFFNTNQHLSDIYLLLGCSAGAEGPKDLEGLLNIRANDRGICARILQQLNLYGYDYIIVNPNVSDLLIERRWPEKKWRLFLDVATKVWPSLIFLLVGSSSEKAYVNEIFNSLSVRTQENVKNIAGQLSIGEYLALIEKSKAMLTCDSGPMHIAVALDRPTLSIWGPGSPQHYGVIKPNHRIIYEPIYCSPCLYHADFPPCKGDNQCLKRILVKTVLKEFSNLINIPFPKDELLDTLLLDDAQDERNKKIVLGLVKG